MGKFKYTKTHTLAQLTGELVVAIDMPPIIRRDGEKVATYTVEGGLRDNVVTITVPDSVPKADVDAVVEAHVPDPDYGKPVYADRASTMRTMPDSEFRETMIRWGKVSNMLPEIDE